MILKMENRNKIPPPRSISKFGLMSNIGAKR
jgi:hypothetical protein